MKFPKALEAAEYSPLELPRENLLPRYLLVSSCLTLAGMKYPILLAPPINYDDAFICSFGLFMGFVLPFSFIYVWECWLSIFVSVEEFLSFFICELF